MLSRIARLGQQLTSAVRPCCSQEDKELPELGVLKNVMAHNWVEPSKRERKRVLNYSEAEYYKQVRGQRREGRAEARLQQPLDLQSIVSCLGDGYGWIG
jgi:hypothetical protein